MSFFTPQTRVVRIDEENRVTIRKLTYGERQEILSQCMQVSAGAGEEVSLDPARMQRMAMHKCIVSWDGPGFDGRPVTPENIDALPAPVVDVIREAVDELNAGLDAAEKND
ncbi:MAG TPA: hypothetical protein ENK62_02645 [Chromatiales bacterium]|nr:hypothetical protein [Chromatiales bacterium]